MPVTIVIGAGPGIGRSVARRFEREGFETGLISRTGPYQADVADEKSLRTALDAAVADLGLPEVVVYNAAVIRPDTPGELTVDEHLDRWRVNVLGAYVAAAHLAPAMAAWGHGTFLVTGGMPEPKAGYSSLSLGKAGVRTLVALFAEQHPELHCISNSAVPRSPSPARSPRALRSIRTTSPSTTGGCTTSPAWSGSWKPSTTGASYDQPQPCVKQPAR
ncbi:MAG TPA: SDR family NAD(P)-dependent oxidoreductase [Amycolatopsis sp.]|jgi:NAD(P)-dependent dehydrogenase (short-subunit alcohol dehydrogenase family)